MVKRAPSNEARMHSLLILGFMFWVENDWSGLFLMEQVPPRYELWWLDSESRALTVTPQELVWWYTLLIPAPKKQEAGE